MGRQGIFWITVGREGSSHCQLLSLKAGEVSTDSLCSAVGQKYNRTAAEVGLRWVLRQSGVVVVKASDPKYLKQDLEALTWDMRDSDASLLNNATEPKGQQDGRPSWGCGR